jgi:hypothetical protein
MGLLKTIIIIVIAIYVKTLIKSNIDKLSNFFNKYFKDVPFYDMISNYLGNQYKDMADAYIILIIIIIIMVFIF